jgi:hypothetical protein
MARPATLEEKLSMEMLLWWILKFDQKYVLCTAMSYELSAIGYEPEQLGGGGSRISVLRGNSITPPQPRAFHFLKFLAVNSSKQTVRPKFVY